MSSDDAAAAATAAATAAAPAAPAAGEGKTVDHSESSGKRWFPLESNPEVMNKYVEKLGFLADGQHQFVDVLSTEEWALEMVPQPVRAVLFLYPVSAVAEAHRLSQQAEIATTGQEVSKRVWYTKQTVGNACGTIALIHSIANAFTVDSGAIAPESFFDRFLRATGSMTPEERAAALEADSSLDEAHETAASEGQTAVGSIDDDVDTHFICFSCVDGHLYELDGRKSAPINHGPCEPEELLTKAAGVISEFMARDPTSVRFAITALAAADDGADE